MKLRFTRQATQDLNSIADYVSEQNPQAALRVPAVLTVCLRYQREWNRKNRHSIGSRRAICPMMHELSSSESQHAGRREVDCPAQ